jgi:hypothetical protein
MNNNLKYGISDGMLEDYLGNDPLWFSSLDENTKRHAKSREKITDTVRYSQTIQELAEESGKTILEYLSRIKAPHLKYLQRKKIKLENDIKYGKKYKELFLRETIKEINKILDLPIAKYHDYSQKSKFDNITNEVLSIQSLLDEGKISFRQRSFLVKFINSKETSFTIEGNSKLLTVIFPKNKKNELDVVEYLFGKIDLEEETGTSIKNLTFKFKKKTLTKKITENYEGGDNIAKIDNNVVLLSMKNIAGKTKSN